MLVLDRMEVVGHIPDPSGPGFAVIRHAGRLYRVAVSAEGEPRVDKDTLNEIARVYKQDPQSARSMGVSLGELDSEIIPLSLEDALESVASGAVRWEPSFAASPAAVVIDTYRDRFPTVRPYLLALLLVALFSAALVLSPPVASMLGIAESTPPSNVLFLLFFLLLLGVLLVDRSLSSFVLWWLTMSREGAGTALRSLRGPARVWAIQSAVFLVAFSLLAALLLDLLVKTLV